MSQIIRIAGPRGNVIGIVQITPQFNIPRLLAAANPTALRLITDYYGAVYILDDDNIAPKLKAAFSLFEYNGIKYGFRGDYPSPKYIFNKDTLWDELVKHNIKYIENNEPLKTIRRTDISLTYQGQPCPVAITDKRTRYFSECFEEIPSIAMSHVKDNSSPLFFYMSNRDELRKQAAKKGRFFPLSLFELMNERTRVPKHFPVDLAKSLYQIFGAKKVLDPSAGWADRMISAAAAQVEEYVGIDPNSKLRNMYWSVKQYLATKSATKITTIEDGFLEAQLPLGYFDTILTSPPYWNYEIYSEDEKQSIKQHQTINTWINNFMKPYLSKCADCLSQGGVLILRMSDTSAGLYISELIEHTVKNTDLKFQGVIAVAKSEDYIFIFSKPHWVPVSIEKFGSRPNPWEGNRLKVQDLVEKDYFKALVGKLPHYDKYVYYRKEFNPVNLVEVIPNVVVIRKYVSKDTYDAQSAGAEIIITPDPASKAYEFATLGSVFVLPPFNIKFSQMKYQKYVLRYASKYIPPEFAGTLYVSNQETMNVLQTQDKKFQIMKYSDDSVPANGDLIWT